MDGPALSKSFELLSRYCPADVNGIMVPHFYAFKN